MPKRQLILLESVAEWDWLCQCAVRAARGKRQRHSIQRYFADFENSTARIRQALLKGDLPIGGYTCFDIRDPKQRTIHAAPFADRVAHHALIGKMAPRLEQSWVDSSYACRPGKGSHAAVIEALRIAQLSPWIVKLDVHSYFAFINHDTLRGLLHRQFKGVGLFQLLDSVLQSYNVKPGRGLPIGALTSQYFANHYLDRMQRFLRTQMHVKAELRYMDDFWIGCDSAEHAREIVAASNDWLKQYRQLSLKPACIQRSNIGMTFCGFHISKRGIRPGTRRRRSMMKQYRQMVADYLNDDCSELHVQSQLCAINALCKPGDHRTLMKRLISTSGVDQIC
jgi:hypothetical protein